MSGGRKEQKEQSDWQRVVSTRHKKPATGATTSGASAASRAAFNAKAPSFFTRTTHSFSTSSLHSPGLLFIPSSFSFFLTQMCFNKYLATVDSHSFFLFTLISYQTS